MCRTRSCTVGTMAHNRGDAGEGWDLDLRWPQDNMISPLVPASPRTDAAGADEKLGDGDARVGPAEIGEVTDEAAVPELSSADRQREAFVPMLNPAMADLVAATSSTATCAAIWRRSV